MTVRGTPESLRRTLRKASEAQIFSHKGSRVRLGRWGQWFEAVAHWRGSKFPCPLVLPWMGIQRSWWQDLSEVSILHVHEALSVTQQPGQSSESTSAGASSSSAGSLVTSKLGH